jgi:phosphatidate cytidylyltransferase
VQMRQRIITALWAIPLVFVFVYFDTPALGFPLIIFLIGVLAVLGSIEFYRLASLAGGQPLKVFGILWALFFVAGAHFDEVYITSSLLASAVALPLIWLFVFRRDRLLLNWGWTLAGILYMGWMLGHWVSLRELDHGRELVVFALLSTFACDTAAFFVGRTWGKHLLAPTISPKKTWEGAIAGFIAAVAVALVLRVLLNLNGWDLPLSYAHTIALGCLIGLFAQLGDLLESLLKRRAGAKDSGSLMPGHGGILDRIDSLVFTGAIVYYYALLVVEIG